MATKSPPSRAKASVGKVERDLQLSFETANEPNADILMQSLRVSGYTLEGTLEDLADNSIDAGAARVAVHLERDSASDEWTVYIADDGCGMDRQALDQMMRLGSRVDHDADTDLGAFGMGSDTATLAIAKRKHVITLGEDGLLSGIWDLDVIRERQEFVKHLDKATPAEAKIFEEAFGRYNLQVPDHGTVVLIGKGDRVHRVRVPDAARAVAKSFSWTYRRFLAPNGPLEMTVNGETVNSVDPLMRDNPETEILFDDAVDFAFRDGEGDRRVEKFGVTIVHLPDFGGPELNRRAGISIDTSGFYVTRNNREIVRGDTLRLYKRHNELSRFRAELSFPGGLDEQLGVTFLKSAVAVNPSQGLRDKIKEVVFPYRRQSQHRFRSSKKDADIQVPHDEAAKQIKSKSALLRTPGADVAPEQTPSNEGNGKGAGSSGRTRKPSGRTATARRRLATEARFEAKDLGEHDPFYEPSLDQKQVVVTYNAKHPAYERLILDNRENRGQLAAIDYLVYSLASAELREVDDEKAAFAERMRIDMSFNLKQLLKQ
jgi:hypothetical protein